MKESKPALPEEQLITQLLRLIADLEACLVEVKQRLPAHSIPPALLVEMDELDEQLAQARRRLAEME